MRGGLFAFARKTDVFSENQVLQIFKIDYKLRYLCNNKLL